IKVFEKENRFKLDDQFLKEISKHAFSGTNGEDAVGHIESLLEKRGNDEEVLTNDELSNPGDKSLIKENEIAEIFRIELTYFNLRHLYVPWVASRPWLDYGPWMEPRDDVEHVYKPFRFKSGHAKWPTYYGWYEEHEDGELKEEALREKSMFKGSRAPCSPIDEWEHYEHTTYIETHVKSKNNIYLDICQIIINYAGTNNDNVIQDEKEPKNEDDVIGNLDDYLVRKDAPYYVNEDEERYKERETVAGTNNDNVIQDEKEPKNEDDVIGNLDDYLVRKDAPYYVNEDEERYKERGCKLLGIPYTKPPTHKTERFKIIK
ncbi:hypothetical protein Tco_0606997, partial [Tanacetum coccineum]